MALRTITATAFSRNFSDLLNQVRYQGMSFEIKRGADVVARITPPGATAGFPIAELDSLLAGLPALAADEADAFLADVRDGRGQLVNGDDAWGS